MNYLHVSSYLSRYAFFVFAETNERCEVRHKFPTRAHALRPGDNQLCWTHPGQLRRRVEAHHCEPTSTRWPHGYSIPFSSSSLTQRVIMLRRVFTTYPCAILRKRRVAAVEPHSQPPESRSSARPIRRVPWREPRAGGADATRGMRHADRARSSVSPRPTTDAPARRLPHNRAPGGLHGYCEHSHSHHGWPVDRACLARHATPDGSGSEYSSHATNEASHTRGCQSHLHAGADWLQSARQCAQPSEPAR